MICTVVHIKHLHFSTFLKHWILLSFATFSPFDRGFKIVLAWYLLLLEISNSFSRKQNIYYYQGVYKLQNYEIYISIYLVHPFIIILLKLCSCIKICYEISKTK